jgi:heat shock protein HtpX
MKSQMMKNQTKTILLLGLLSALLIGLGGLVAPGQLWLFGVLALALNLGAYFFSDKLVLRMHGARELSTEEAPGLHQTVQDLARRAGIPTPRVFLIPEAQPNAFATGRNPAHGVVAVTRGILDLLTDRELRGVLAHEIAHIKNRDILLSSIAAALSTALTYLAHALSFSALLGRSEDGEEGNPLGGILVALVAPLAGTLVQLGISRAREHVADETAARLTGDPRALASALLRLEQGVALANEHGLNEPRPATASLFIVSPLFGEGGLSRLFSTHPATEERVRRLLALERPGDPAVVLLGGLR